MNILRVIASMNPSSGGPCQGIRNTIPELEKLGHKNEVICLDDPHADFLEKDNFPIYALGPGKGPWNYNKKLLPWLMENLERFDVVIVHGLWLYHGFAVNKALSKYKNFSKKDKSRIPRLFVMPHGMLDPYFQEAADRKFKALRNWVYWKLIEVRLIENSDGILFTCETELQLARNTFRPYRPKKEINVGYGISDPPKYTPEMRSAFLKLCPELTGRPYFLFLSRIHEKKGVDFLIKAYSEIFKKDTKPKSSPVLANKTEGSEESPIRGSERPLLVVAGPGQKTTYGENMQKLAEEANFPDVSIIFPGMLTGDAKWGAFYGCEAFVLPSHQENFGIAVVEALACSKPVLISTQVNIFQEIKETGGGITANDTLEGTKFLLKSWELLSHGEKEEMGRKGRISYTRFFAIQSHVLRLTRAIG